MKINKIITLSALGLLLSNMFCAQGKSSPPPEANQFDFWLGEWELTWNDSMKGSNTITKEMDGYSIHENFNDPKNKFKGESWSVYNVVKNKWQQTWIDNSGSYMVFEGEMKDGKMELSFEKIDKDGKPIIMSMIFFNITSNAFDWDWRQSNDNGKTWKSLWKIHYKKRVEFNYNKMRTYYFVMLKKGPKRDQDSITAAKIQEGHLKNLFNLHEMGKLSMAGPFMDDGDIRGICIYSVATKEELEKLIALDPAIKSGRLIAEIHPWYAMPGSCLPE